MATRSQVRKEFNKRLDQAGQYFLTKQPADLGNASGVVQVPDTENMIYVRLSNGQVIEVFNNIAPNIYNWKVYIGTDKSQSIVKVLESRWVYNITQTVAYVLFHHKQHEYPNPDTVWIMRDQFMPLLVLPAGGFTVKLFGDVIPTSPPIRVADQVLDLSTYVNSTDANYVLVEILPDGTVDYVVGDSYSDLAILRLTAPIPTPTEGSVPVCAIEFYAGQTGIRRDSTERNIIDLRMFTSSVVPTTGTQINTADADTPLDDDLFGFWDVIDNALKNITWANTKALLKAYFDTLYNPITTTHFEPVTATVEREFAQFEVAGALAMESNVTIPILITKPTTLAACYITCGNSGSSGSTICDINLNGSTIFTTSANRPELDNTETYSQSGVPDTIDLVIGDILTLDIDQIATGASDLKIPLMEVTDELVYSSHSLVMTEIPN